MTEYSAAAIASLYSIVEPTGSQAQAQGSGASSAAWRAKYPLPWRHSENSVNGCMYHPLPEDLFSLLSHYLTMTPFAGNDEDLFSSLNESIRATFISCFTQALGEYRRQMNTTDWSIALSAPGLQLTPAEKEDAVGLHLPWYDLPLIDSLLLIVTFVIFSF